MTKHDPLVFLDDILRAIEKIERYVQGLAYEEFINDDKTLQAVIQNLQIIGEAARNIPIEVRNLAKTVPWKKVISMRNRMIHEYWGVDTRVVWNTIEDWLPALKNEVKKLIDALESGQQELDLTA